MEFVLTWKMNDGNLQLYNFWLKEDVCCHGAVEGTSKRIIWYRDVLKDGGGVQLSKEREECTS